MSFLSPVWLQRTRGLENVASYLAQRCSIRARCLGECRSVQQRWRRYLELNRHRTLMRKNKSEMEMQIRADIMTWTKPKLEKKSAEQSCHEHVARRTNLCHAANLPLDYGAFRHTFSSFHRHCPCSPPKAMRANM